MSEASDIRTKIEALLKRNGEIFLAHHNGDNYYSEKYTQKLESLVRASVGLVEALEFYGIKANWELSEITLDNDRKPFWYLRTTIKNDCEEFDDKDARGGKCARNAIAAFAAEVEKAGKS